jgi:hypothetical protein
LTNTGGTARLLPGASAEITGNPLNPLSTLAYVQVGGGTAATYLHGNSELVTPDMSIAIDTGILATVYDSGVGNANATIRTALLEIRGGDIYIDYQGTPYHFGELVVAGNVKWTGGTFHVYVYSDGMTNDVWRTTNPGGNSGRFDIDGGTVAPIYLDSDYGTSSLPTSGTDWEVLKAGGGFVDNDAPSVDDPILWSMEIDTLTPPIFWALVAN